MARRLNAEKASASGQVPFGTADYFFFSGVSVEPRQLQPSAGLERARVKAPALKCRARVPLRDKGVRE